MSSTAHALAASQPSHYCARRAVFPDDRDLVIGLWRGNLGDPTHVESKFEWFYERSPTGEPLAILLCLSDPSQAEEPQAVGVAAAGRRPFKLGNEPLEAAVLVDMTVSPRHRTLFPALVLQKAVFEAALTGGHLLYGFPNPKAAPVFQRAGYRKLGVTTRHVRVLRAAGYLRDRMPAAAAAVLGPIWDLFARLRFRSGAAGELRLQWIDAREAVAGPEVAYVSSAPLLRGARTAAILRWRFAARAGRTFSFVGVHGGEGTANLGYWIVEAESDVLHVRDCAAALLTGAIARRAWTLLFDEARQRGFRSVSFECLAPAEFVLTLRQIGMTPRSERPLFGAVRENYATAVAAARWYLTAADEDE